jgi:tetratricopeptide (TPR) repeat protein
MEIRNARAECRAFGRGGQSVPSVCRLAKVIGSWFHPAMRPLLLALLVWPLLTVRAEDWLVAGDAAYAKFDLDQAVETYRQAKAADTNNYEATWKLARAINDQGILMKRSPEQKQRFLEAQALATEATKLDPKDSKGYVFLAIAQGKVALYEGGKKKVELGKDVKAQAEKAIELNPKEDLAYHVLGLWHREMATLNPFLRTFAEWFYGKFPAASLDSAVANLQKAVELDGSAIAHRVELGSTYMELKKWAQAKPEFEKAIELSRQYPADENYQKQAREELSRVNQRVGR